MTGSAAAAVRREADIGEFLTQAGWATALRTPLAGDASPRRYERLICPSRGAAVLMDADPAKGEDVRPFVRIAAHLRGLGVSVPAIYAADEAQGLLLLEDLGDDLFARLARADPTLETVLYEAAIDLLVSLHRAAPPPGVPAYGPPEMAPLAGLAAVWYAPGCAGAMPDPQADTARTLARAAEAVLSASASGGTVLVHRDYHAENLLWLPGRTGIGRVGLIDFQDAASGHPAYDLVSLLEDARRDVPATLRQEMTERYISASGADPQRFAAACAALSAQRNLRILGVFARLSLRDGKAGYIGFIPRVWQHLQRDLSHPACAALKEAAAFLPPPTPEALDRLRENAGSCPTR